MMMLAVLFSPALPLAATPASIARMPIVHRNQDAGRWRIFRPPLRGPYSDIMVGPGNAVWISTTKADALLRINADGTTVRLRLHDFDALTMTTGADGRIYMTQYLPQTALGAVTTGGHLSLFKYSNDDDEFYDTALVLGADGNVWYGEMDHVASISPAGAVTEYNYFYGEGDNGGVSLFATPTAVWYTVCCQTVGTAYGFVGYVDLASHFLTEFPLTDFGCQTFGGVVVAGDGRAYALCTNTSFYGPGAIVSIDPKTDRVTTFPYYGIASAGVDAMIVGPDGNVWFAPGTGGAIGRFDIRHEAFDLYYTPDGSSPTSLTVGPDGNIWSVAGSAVEVFRVKPKGG